MIATLLPATLLPATLLLAVSAPPQDDPVELVDLVDLARQEAQDYWTRAASALNARHGVGSVLPSDPAADALRKALHTTRLASLSVDDEESLSAIVQLLSAQTGLPLVVDRRAEEAACDEGLVFNLNWTNPVAVADVLDVLTGFVGDEVDWTVRDGVVLVTLAERAHEQVVFLHPVADLGPFFHPEDVATMVQENVHPRSWEREGVSIDIQGPFLLVVHEGEVQLGTEAFLGRLRTFQASLAGRPTFEPSDAELAGEATLGRLEGVRFAPSFDGAPLTDVAAFLQQITGLNFLVSSAVIDELDPEETAVSLRLPEMDVRTVLDLIVETSPSLVWTLHEGIVRIQLAEEQRADVMFALYDARDIIGPAGMEFSVARALYGDDDLEPLVMGPSMLEDLIRNHIAPQSWDMDPSNALRISESGLLVVNQSPQVHGQIRALLKDLQAVADVLLEVQAQQERDR